MSSSARSDGAGPHGPQSTDAVQQRWHLPGLADDPGAADPAWLHHLVHASDERLAHRFTQLAVRLREQNGLRTAVAALIGDPEAEVAASPFALRACAWAASEGFFSVPHELRLAVPWPAALEGGAEVADPRHGSWEEGRLHVGKYRSFLQDETVVVRDPNHHAKWTPHELLHRVMRFLWRPGLSARELYLGARLNELLPVVLWYGLDEVLRLEGIPFRRDTAPREPEATPERARWWTLPPEGLMDRARVEVHAFRSAMDHYRHEMDALATEIRSGQTVRVPHPFLDASSDALAYGVGHHPRLRAPTVARLLEALTEEGRDRDASPAAAWQRVHRGLQHLLYGEIVLDVPLARTRATGRALFDLLHRAAHGLEDPGHPLFDLLPEAREALDDAWNGRRAVPLDGWQARIADALTGAACKTPVLRAGHPGQPVTAAQCDRIREGLESCLPATVRAVAQREQDDGWIEAFVRSPAFARRRSLAVRFEAWLAAASGPPIVRDLAVFERALLEVGAGEPADRWLVLPVEDLEDPDRVEVRAGTAFRCHRFERDVLAAHEAILGGIEGWVDAVREAAPTVLLIGSGEEGVVVVPVPASVGEAWEGVRTTPCLLPEWMERLEVAAERERSPVDGEGWMDELIAAGAVVMVPVWPREALRLERGEAHPHPAG